MFASPGSMIDDDLRRGYGVCEETGRGNLSSSKSSRAACTAMLISFRFFHLRMEKQGKKSSERYKRTGRYLVQCCFRVNF